MPSLSLMTREEFLEQLSAMPVACCAIIDEDTACAICMKEPVDAIINADEDEKAVLLHETHSFGEKCARQWLSSSNTCPKCRTVRFEEDDVESQGDDVEMSDANDGEEMTFDEDEMAHLLWEAGRIIARDPKTEAFDDREVMSVWFSLWTQLILAQEDSDADECWANDGPASREVTQVLDELLKVRLRWYQHSPAQLNVAITESFEYTEEERWRPSAADLNKRVRIDFDGGMMSTLHSSGLISGSFLEAFNVDNACLTAAGHPLVSDVYSRLEGLLHALEGKKLRIGSLRRKLHRELGDPDELELRFDLPVGWPNVIRFVIDETCIEAARRYDAQREANAVLAAAAARLDALRAARDALANEASAAPVSTCPRMSAPSTRTRPRTPPPPAE